VVFLTTLYEAFSLLIIPFWDVILYSLVHRRQCLGGNFCLLLLNPETTSGFSKTLLFISDTTQCHNISVSFEVLCSHSDADEDSLLLEFTLCRMVNSCRHLKEHNASIFRVKQ